MGVRLDQARTCERFPHAHEEEGASGVIIGTTYRTIGDPHTLLVRFDVPLVCGMLRNEFVTIPVHHYRRRELVFLAEDEADEGLTER